MATKWLGLLPETEPVVLDTLDTTRKGWMQYRPVIEQLIHGDYHTVVIRQFLANEAVALEQANTLSNEILSYHGASLSLAMRSGLNEAAAQRMRTQRALRLLCLVLNDIGGKDMLVALKETVTQIDTGFTVLAEGGRGVPAAPNARIKRNLRTASLFWSKMRPTFDGALARNAVLETDVAKTLKLNKSVLKQLNQAVEGYLPSGS